MALELKLSGTAITEYLDVSPEDADVVFPINQPHDPFPTGWTVTGTAPNRELVAPNGSVLSAEWVESSAEAPHSDGGQGLPSEWTVGDAGGLLIQPDVAGVDAALTLAGAPEAAYNETIFNVQEDGASDVLRVEVGGGVFLSGSQLNIDNGGPFFTVADSLGTAAADTWIFSFGNGDVIYKKSGHLYIKKHTAPDDSSLSNGELALWFDQTNGAAKLMVKAKTANGTVVTGNLALS